jgi:hypothetical protein
MLYDMKSPGVNVFLYIFLLIGWPIAILASDPAQKGYAHYYINWLPYVGLLGGFAVFWLQSRFSPRGFSVAWREWVVLLLSLTLCVGIFVFTGRAGEYGRILERFAHRDKQGTEFRTATAIYAENHTKPGDYVLFWSAWPGENYMADRESPTASLYYPLYVNSDISTRLSDQFFDDLVEKKPVLIVDIGHLNTLSLDPAERQARIDEGVGWQDLPDNTYQVLQYIDRNYHKEAVIKNKAIYRLNGTE